MTSLIRVRRHIDGRVALQVPADRSAWSVVKVGGQEWVHQDYVVSDGWSELLVAELPEPDYEIMGELVWDRIPQAEQEGSTEVVAATAQGAIRIDDLAVSLDVVRSNALKMLAAVAACERYRVEWGAT